MRPLLRALEALSVLELASIVLLLTNLMTIHLPGVASLLGPVHGALYLTVAVTALLGRGLLLRTRLLAIVPVLGGVFTLLNVRREARRDSERALAGPQGLGSNTSERWRTHDGQELE
jgi:hypothetical protein